MIWNNFIIENEDTLFFFSSRYEDTPVFLGPENIINALTLTKNVIAVKALF